MKRHRLGKTALAMRAAATHAMFPLRQVRRPQQKPLVTRALVLAMAAVFVWQVALSYGALSGLGAGSERAFVEQWGARPRCLLSPSACHIELAQIGDRPWWILRRWLSPLLASAFLHAGWLHLGFNAWFLWVFGPAVEDRLGRLKYLGFYLACAVASALAYAASAAGSAVPMVGASGAIAGILGAHLLLAPRSWIVSYIPPMWLVPIPSVAFLLVWMAGQLAGAQLLGPLAHALSLAGLHLDLDLGHKSGAARAAGQADIAWAAHIGGFAFGALCAWRALPGLTARAQRERQARAEQKAAVPERGGRSGRAST